MSKKVMLIGTVWLLLVGSALYAGWDFFKSRKIVNQSELATNTCGIGNVASVSINDFKCKGISGP